MFAAIAAAEQDHPGFEYVTREDISAGDYLLRRDPATSAPTLYIGIGGNPVTPDEYFATLLRAIDDLDGAGVVHRIFPRRRADAERRVGH